jgi:hypothetical protein
MKAILRRLNLLSDSELFSLSEALDAELERRSVVGDEVPDSARRRAVERQESYRRRSGAMAPPVKAKGLGKAISPRRAA